MANPDSTPGANSLIGFTGAITPEQHTDSDHENQDNTAALIAWFEQFHSVKALTSQEGYTIEPLSQAIFAAIKEKIESALKSKTHLDEYKSIGIAWESTEEEKLSSTRSPMNGIISSPQNPMFSEPNEDTLKVLDAIGEAYQDGGAVVILRRKS